MKHTLNRLLSLFLALCFALTPALVPVGAASEDGTTFLTAGALEMTVTELTAPAAGVPGAPGDLFLGYLEQREGLIPTLQASVGDSLTGAERQLYVRLRELAAEVAAGERQSTEFKIYPGEMPDFPAWSQQVSVDDYPAVSAANNSIINFDRVFSAVMADAPFDLYYCYSFGGGPATESGSFTVINGMVNLTYDYYVVRIQPSGVFAGSDEYTVRSDLGDVINTVTTTARGIVDKNAGKSDYEKLLAYKEAICERTSYNDDALHQLNGFTGDNNNNPWQILYVFDGDPSTTVVCEGYSKAFKYLCDLSEFRAPDFSCWLVSGYLSGGGHMWNHVTLNGKTYLVDVTNCDDGKVGWPSHLFMEPPASVKATEDSGLVYTFQFQEPGYMAATVNYFGVDYDENIYRDTPYVLDLSMDPYEEPAEPPAPTYPVTVYGGTLTGGASSGTCEVGTEVTVTPGAAPEGTRFYGWRYQEEGGASRTVEASADSYTFAMPDKAVTLLAVCTYPVLFNDNGGGASPVVREVVLPVPGYVEDTQTYGSLPLAERTGYTFDGWFTDTDGGEQITADSVITADGPRTLYAHWTAIPNEIATAYIEYGENGGVSGTCTCYASDAVIWYTAFDADGRFVCADSVRAEPGTNAYSIPFPADADGIDIVKVFMLDDGLRPLDATTII